MARQSERDGEKWRYIRRERNGETEREKDGERQIIINLQISHSTIEENRSGETRGKTEGVSGEKRNLSPIKSKTVLLMV